MKVKVGLREYQVTKPTEILEVGGELYGKHDPRESEITIADKYDQLQKNETFLHELIHAICFQQDLQRINDDEHEIELLSKGLHMVICDNPHLFTMADI